MRQKVVSLFLCYLLLYTCGVVEAGKDLGVSGGLWEEEVESFRDPDVPLN